MTETTTTSRPAITAAENREIAEWCGWKFIPGSKHLMTGDCWAQEDGHLRSSEPNYVDERGEWSWREFERLAEERGKFTKYFCCLTDVICDDRTKALQIDYNRLAPWVTENLIRAPADDRCRALLRVIREEKNAQG